jgi:hypothetical protein
MQGHLVVAVLAGVGLAALLHVHPSSSLSL